MFAIEVKDITKKFRVYFDKGYSLKERLLFRNRSRYEDRWVLNGISFSVSKGEAIGLVGHNGCGKSTMLKLMTRIMYPDMGSIKMEGRVSSLIELGAGFHPDMSGRENIYTNAAIFGLSRKEIQARIQDIIDFSELEEAIDNPVRTYSSGMYMRLAFSVAINVDADILLIDEILAVGDASFQAKCFNKLKAIKASGVTIVIVSHALGQIEQICERSIWINEGLIRLEGSPREVHPAYLEFMGERMVSSDLRPEPEKSTYSEGSEVELEKKETRTDSRRWGSGDARITRVVIKNHNGEERGRLQTGKPATVEICYRQDRNISRPSVGVMFNRIDSICCYGTNTLIDRLEPFELNHKGRVVFHIESMQLLPGEYWLDVAISSESAFDCDYWQHAVKFEVFSSIQDTGVARLIHRWEIQ